MNKARFVADGQQRIKETEDYQQKEIEIRAKVQHKYRTEMIQPGLFKRWILGLKMQREIEHGIQELTPERAVPHAILTDI